MLRKAEPHLHVAPRSPGIGIASTVPALALTWPSTPPQDVEDSAHPGGTPHCESVAAGHEKWGIFRLSTKKRATGASVLVAKFIVLRLCIEKTHVYRMQEVVQLWPMKGEDESTTLRRAKHWAAQAMAYRKQWEHVFLADVWSNPPSDAELQRQVVSVVPWAVLTDVEQENMSQAELDRHFGGTST